MELNFENIILRLRFEERCEFISAAIFSRMWQIYKDLP